jgi:hypothetical protein
MCVAWVQDFWIDRFREYLKSEDFIFNFIIIIIIIIVIVI